MTKQIETFMDEAEEILRATVNENKLFLEVWRCEMPLTDMSGRFNEIDAILVGVPNKENHFKPSSCILLRVYIERRDAIIHFEQGNKLDKSIIPLDQGWEPIEDLDEFSEKLVAYVNTN